MAKIKRFPFHADQWADIHTRPTWGQLGLIMDSHADPDTTQRQRVTTTVLALCSAWRVLDPEDPEKELPLSIEGIDRADAALIVAIHDECSKAMDVTLPKK